MKKFPCPFLLLTALMGASALHGTTVIPPTFDELVNRAQVIFQGVTQHLLGRANKNGG